MNVEDKRAYLIAALLLAIAGCGGGGAYSETTSEEATEGAEAEGAESGAAPASMAGTETGGGDNSLELVQQQAELAQNLSEVLARRRPDCGAACTLGGSICDLAHRICGVSARNRTDPELAQRCQDAGDRCDSARERVAERCTCE